MAGEAVVDRESVFKEMLGFYCCGGCRKVRSAEDLSHLILDSARSCCGSLEPASIWPDPAIVLFIQTARAQPVTEEGSRIQSLMLAAAGEAVLQQSVWTVLEGRINDVMVAEALRKRLPEPVPDVVRGSDVELRRRHRRMPGALLDLQRGLSSS
jgi:hypothetical protein